MKVRVYPFREKIAYGNILWPGKFPVRPGGTFPATHPCAASSVTFSRDLGGQCGAGIGLDAFRAKGYWASCFPEGDGITWQPLNGQSDEQCLADIRAAFDWDAEWDPAARPLLAPSIVGRDVSDAGDGDPQGAAAR